MLIIKPTRHERLFNQFLQKIEWGFLLRYKWQKPMQVYNRKLFPDFRLLPCRLIIEIDGSVHWDYAVNRDCKRDFWFEDCGYKVLHLSNRDVEMITERILAERIQRVYPSFPEPSEEMDRLHKRFRERGLDWNVGKGMPVCKGDIAPISYAQRIAAS